MLALRINQKKFNIYNELFEKQLFTTVFRNIITHLDLHNGRKEKVLIYLCLQGYLVLDTKKLAWFVKKLNNTINKSILKIIIVNLKYFKTSK